MINSHAIAPISKTEILVLGGHSPNIHIFDTLTSVIEAQCVDQARLFSPDNQCAQIRTGEVVALMRGRHYKPQLMVYSRGSDKELIQIKRLN